MKSTTLILPLTLVLAACSQSDAPSEQVEAAAEELVGAVIETPTPASPDEIGPYAPRSDCAELDGAQNFIAMLGSAVEARDTDVLVALAANDVKLGFGGDDGSANLRRALDAQGGALWDELARLTQLGCAVNDQGGITMPWYFAQQFDGDPFTTMIVTGEDVAVHAEPRGNAARLGSLSWEKVVLLPDNGPPPAGTAAAGDGGDPSQGWAHVRLEPEEGAEPVEGYVRRSSLRSLVDYRLLATSRNGRWRITALLAGD